MNSSSDLATSIKKKKEKKSNTVVTLNTNFLFECFATSTSYHLVKPDIMNIWIVIWMTCNVTLKMYDQEGCQTSQHCRLSSKLPSDVLQTFRGIRTVPRDLFVVRSEQRAVTGKRELCVSKVVQKLENVDLLKSNKIQSCSILQKLSNPTVLSCETDINIWNIQTFDSARFIALIARYSKYSTNFHKIKLIWQHRIDHLRSCTRNTLRVLNRKWYARWM